MNRVLVVCSANQCRSPLGAAVLADRLERLGLAVAVDSAGTRASEGIPATESTQLAAARGSVEDGITITLDVGV